MNTDLLRQLLTVRDAGSLSAAAEQLFTTQPSLTRNMRKLERELGTELFDRSHRSVRLNRCGEVACDLAALLLHQEDELLEKVKLAARAAHEVHIGACAPMPLAKALSTASETLPNSTVSGELAEADALRAQLVDGELQLAILPYRLEAAELTSSPLMRERLFANLREGDELAGRDKVQFSELDGSTFLLNTRIGVWRELVENMMPHSRFLLQESLDAVNEVARYSTLPAFTTDVSLALNGPREGRFAVPFANDEATITFHVHARRDWIQNVPQLAKRLRLDPFA